MIEHVYDRVIEHPKFAELTSRRNRFAVTLSLIVLAVYYTFVMIAALKPATFASPLSEGATWCLGLVAGFLIQGFAFLMTGIYVRRANGEFDRLTRQIIEEASR